MLLEERQHSVVEDLGGGDRRLAVIELGEGHLGVGVDEGLLIDAAHALQRADIEGILGAAIAGAFALELAVGLLLGLGLLERGDLGFGQQDAFLRHLGFQRLQALFHRWSGRGAATRSARRPARSTDPRRFSALETRTWPQAGCSIAIVDHRLSRSRRGVRFFSIGLRAADLLQAPARRLCRRAP